MDNASVWFISVPGASPEIQRLDKISQIQENYLRSTPGRKEILAESLKHLCSKVDSICYFLYGVTDGEKELIESIGRR